MPANHSINNHVKRVFQNCFVALLRRVAKDLTSSLLSWHKRYDFTVKVSEECTKIFINYVSKLRKYRC